MGWLIDTTAKTIQLLPHRIERLTEILEFIAPDQKTIATKDCHKVLGELCSMLIALLGSIGQFALLQEAFRHEDPTQPRLNLYASRKNSHWALWCTFCAGHRIDPFLRNLSDPIPYLQVFAAIYQDGRISPSGRPIRAKTVSEALLSVAQKFTRTGTEDPRKTAHSVIDYRIKSQLRSFEKNDPAPIHVKPVPITLIIHALLFVYQTNPTPERRAVANMMCIIFFFCLCPGEYTGTTIDDQAFALNDAALFLRKRRLHNDHTSESELLAATSLQLTFTTQKNNDRAL